MPVRMKDIAQALDVSIVTVSKALRGHPDIAAETRERILARARELNYRPNRMARSLVTGRSELIGLVVPDLVHPFFGEIAKSLSAALRQLNFFLVVSSSDGDPALEQAEIEHMLAYRLDALVVASCQPTPDLLLEVPAYGTPLILLDRSFPNFPCHFVGADDYQIGVLATEHLIAAGRTRIAHIRGSFNSVGDQRAQGFADTLRKHKLPQHPEYDVSAPFVDATARRDGHTAMDRLLALPSPPDAVFCINDAAALGAMESAHAAGLEIPRDLAIIGCGNYHYDDTLRVPLSSVDQASEAMGQRIAQLIQQIVESKSPPAPALIILAPSLVVRHSSS